MRHHYEKPETYEVHYGRTYRCRHPLYNRCTLFEENRLGLAVIQQRFNPATKVTYWTEIDPWLNDELYLNPGFKGLFEKKAAKPDTNGLYPTITIRQLMWSLRMKPLVKERWETVFDRKDV